MCEVDGHMLGQKESGEEGGGGCEELHTPKYPKRS